MRILTPYPPKLTEYMRGGMAIQVAVYALKIRKRSKKDGDQKLGKVEDAGDFLKSSKI